jgi:hypothetical protein
LSESRREILDGNPRTSSVSAQCIQLRGTLTAQDVIEGGQRAEVNTACVASQQALSNRVVGGRIIGLKAAVDSSDGVGQPAEIWISVVVWNSPVR